MLLWSLLTVFVVYKSVSQLFFGACGFLFVKQMKREPPANTPKNVERIAPSSGESKNSQLFLLFVLWL